MEKQRSFSAMPIRFLVFSFTITFSLVSLIFCFTWVRKPIPSRHLGTLNLGPNSTDLTVRSSKGVNSTSSEHVVTNSIQMGTHFGSDMNSSQIADASSHGGVPESQREREIAEVTVAGSKDAVLISNSSSSPFGKNLSIHGVDAKVGSNSTDGVSDTSIRRQHISVRESAEEKNKGDCDITKGRWFIDESYPLYTNVTCPFIDEGFNCVGNGRLDEGYMKWRWQPQDCDIPRFNATKMLQILRRKRLVFVGDSINRNQWESMLCLLMGGVKDPKKVYEARGRKITKERGNYCFKFEEYKCTVEYHVSHFLVHESKARVGKKRVQTLRIDTIDKGSSRWRGADILVFNTAHWWSHHKTKAGINYYQEGDQVHARLDVTEAFRRALLTWASWVDRNINPHKTRIFYRSSAPSHFSGGLWNAGGHCKEAFQPINQTFTRTYPEKNLMMQEIISQMKNPVTVLNITSLSDYRPDAHPSIYGRRSVNPGVQDCSHWCLPGVPDIWNELLYYNLQLQTRDT